MEKKPGIQLIVGLGNPGLQYEKTRHNVGFWVIDEVASKYDIHLKREAKFKGLLGEANIFESTCKFLMPTTFMNLSGESVLRVANFFKIPVDSILVVHDELDFLPGIVRLKEGGGASGHNGVQNIIDNLGDNNFWRMRIGIGKPIIKEDMVNYVTTSPSKVDTQQIHLAINKAVEVIPDLVLGNFAQAMQELHYEDKKH